jgi:hypothetical protein
MLMIKSQPVPQDVIDAITEVVENEMRPYGIRSVTVTAGEDHDGDEILIVEAKYSRSEEPIDPSVMAGLTSKMRNRLWTLEEDRFPHIRHRFPKEPKVVGYP